MTIVPTSLWQHVTSAPKNAAAHAAGVSTFGTIDAHTPLSSVSNSFIVNKFPFSPNPKPTPPPPGTPYRSRNPPEGTPPPQTPPPTTPTTPPPTTNPPPGTPIDPVLQALADLFGPAGGASGPAVVGEPVGPQPSGGGGLNVPLVLLIVGVAVYAVYFAYKHGWFKKLDKAL